MLYNSLSVPAVASLYHNIAILILFYRNRFHKVDKCHHHRDKRPTEYEIQGSQVIPPGIKSMASHPASKNYQPDIVLFFHRPFFPFKPADKLPDNSPYSVSFCFHSCIFHSFLHGKVYFHNLTYYGIFFCFFLLGCILFIYFQFLFIPCLAQSSSFSSLCLNLSNLILNLFHLLLGQRIELHSHNVQNPADSRCT